MAQMTVDESAVRRMARDAAIYSLTRPSAIVMWVVLAAALLVSILNLRSAGAEGAADGDVSGWLPIAAVGLAVYAVVLSVVSARRAVRVAMPPGSVVWVQVEQDALRLGSGRRTSEIRYDTFQSMRAGRDAVLLKVRGVSVATAIPRALLTDDEVAALRSRIG